MAKLLKPCVLLCAFLSVCLVLFSFFADRVSQHIAYADMQKTAEASAPDGLKKSVGTLFPDLSGITAITLSTPERGFEFRLGGSGEICVNGQQADGDIYNTLVSQIAKLPVSAHAAFDTSGAQLTLTLEITAGGSTHIAHFYTDGLSGEDARIVSGPPGAPKYHLTDGWRVGTLMMTCEGTRIQDERGNEIPSAQVH